MKEVIIAATAGYVHALRNRVAATNEFKIGDRVAAPRSVITYPELKLNAILHKSYSRSFARADVYRYAR